MKSSSKPKVSILMNCFNGEQYLKDSLESILNQTYQDWQLIFFDNVSTDDSLEIFNQYKDSRFKYYLAESHSSLAIARNRAIQKIDSEWIAILDTDDIWNEEKLLRQFSLLEEAASSSQDLIFTNCFIKKDNQFIESRIKFRKEKILEDLLEFKLSIPWPSVMFKKSLYEKVGGFNKNYPNFHDLLFLISCSRFTDFGYLEEKLVTCRYHSKNISLIKKKEGDYYPEILNIFNKELIMSKSAKRGLDQVYARQVIDLLILGKYKSFFNFFFPIKLKQLFSIARGIYFIFLNKFS